MPPKVAHVAVQAHYSDGLLLEQYAYTPGAVVPLPKHTHAEYQFGLSFDCQGDYFYRGARYGIPTGSLSVIHSGEVHAPSDRTSLPEPAHFCMAHIDPTWLRLVAGEMQEKAVGNPFFPTVWIKDAVLNQQFLQLQTVVCRQASRLERDMALWSFIAYLVANHAADRVALSPPKSAPTAVERARGYLHDHFAEDISLEQLAAIADLSRFHFCRVFSKTVGVSPSSYQTQLRIGRARWLLAQGTSITDVAAMTGFYDQSHFGWHFKRQVGTTPGNYVGV